MRLSPALPGPRSVLPAWPLQRPRRALQSFRQSRELGFTLIELMVVLSLITALLALTAPLISAVLRSNAASSAVNQVSAALTSARAVALRDGKDTAVLFISRPGSSASGGDGRLDRRNIEMRMVVGELNPTTRVMAFRDQDKRPPDVLPNSVQVRGPDFTTYSGTGAVAWLPPGALEAAVDNGAWLMVWFGPDGTVRTSLPTGETANFYDHNGNGVNDSGTDPTERAAIPLPYLLVYDGRDYADSKAVDFPDLNAWIADKSNASAYVLMFNRYSGNLLRRKS